MNEQPDYTAAMRAARLEQRRWEAACAALTGWRMRAEIETPSAHIAQWAVEDANVLVAAFERGEDGT